MAAATPPGGGGSGSGGGAPGAAGRRAEPTAVAKSRLGTKRTVELDDLMLRLRAIDGEMPQPDGGQAAAGANGRKPRDRFLEAKVEFLAGMTSLKDILKSQRNQSTVRSQDQVTAAHNIRNMLKELSRLFAEMEALYTKEVRKRRKTIKPEELAVRAQFLQEFKRDLELLKKIATKSSSTAGGPGAGSSVDAAFESHKGDDEYNTSSFFKNLQGPGAASASGGGVGGAGAAKEVELTELQQQSLEQIRLRDEQFDSILDQIGEAVTIAGEQAKAIQDALEVQVVMLDEVEGKVEKNLHQMNEINVTMKKNLESKGFGLERVCINCICFVILLGFVGLIVNVIG